MYILNKKGANNCTTNYIIVTYHLKVGDVTILMTTNFPKPLQVSNLYHSDEARIITVS